MHSAYLALDPGHATGWAKFGEDGNGKGIGTCKTREEVYKLLTDTKPDVIIMEDWISKGGVSFGGDKMETIRVIGAVEFYAYLRGIPIHLQPNTIKSIAYMWAGIKKPKNHALSHETDAYCHGVYFLQRAGVRRPQQGAAT